MAKIRQVQKLEEQLAKMEEQFRKQKEAIEEQKKNAPPEEVRAQRKYPDACREGSQP
mgnify:CR=1 FL=1